MRAPPLALIRAAAANGGRVAAETAPVGGRLCWGPPRPPAGGLAATMVAHRGACPLSTAFPSRPAPALFVLGSRAEVLGLGLLSDPEGYEA